MLALGLLPLLSLRVSGEVEMRFSNCTRLRFKDVRLQQYAETPKQKHAGGYTERPVKAQTYLTEPQGKLEKSNRKEN